MYKTGISPTLKTALRIAKSEPGSSQSLDALIDHKASCVVPLETLAFLRIVTSSPVREITVPEKR
jgi:hypothetical protein